MELFSLFLLIALPWLGDAFETQSNRTKRQSNGFNQITWLKHVIVNNQYVKINGKPKTPTEANPSKYYELAFGKGDEPFDSCRTPRSQDGHCRYIQHCVLDDFANNFRIYLKYACFIQETYVGVCCPDSRYSGLATTRRPPTVTTSLTTTTQPSQPPNSRRCGVNSKQQAQVVGGRPTKLNAYPWMAALLRNLKHHCGGTLLNTRHVMTAAHCFYGFDQTTITVRLGEYTYDQRDETQSTDFSIGAVRIHERYENSTLANDIALITLDKQLDGVIYLPICLPSPRKSFVGVMATVVGWGDTEHGGSLSPTLLEVTLPVWKNSECKVAYADNEIFTENLCAGERDGGKGSCQGDSGGPLMYQENNQWIVIGVVSWGIGCAERGLPGVYVRVTEFLSWIDQNTG